MTLPDLANLMPQARLVFDYLASGRSLTNLVAMANLGVANLTTRIAELRKRGVKIAGEWKRDHNDRRYKSYSMEVEG